MFPVGKEKQCVNFIDSSMISLIEARIEHYFDFLICTYPDNKEKTFFLHINTHLIYRWIFTQKSMYVYGYNFFYEKISIGL